MPTDVSGTRKCVPIWKKNGSFAGDAEWFTDNNNALRYFMVVRYKVAENISFFLAPKTQCVSRYARPSLSG